MRGSRRIKSARLYGGDVELSLPAFILPFASSARRARTSVPESVCFFRLSSDLCYRDTYTCFCTLTLVTVVNPVHSETVSWNAKVL